MTSKLVVNTIEADTGISSVSFASSISMNSTAKFHFSAAGIDIGADTNINRPASGVLGFNINSSEKVRIDSSGNFNQSGSGNIVHYLNTGNNSGDNSTIAFGDSADADAGYINYDHGTNALQIRTNGGSNSIIIDSSGRLGLNQATPASRLHISEASSNTITIQLTNDTTGHTSGTDGMTMGYSSNSAAGFINVCESGSDFTIKTGGTGSANERLRIESWGGIHNNISAIYGGGVANEPKVHFNGAAPSNDPARGHLAVSDSANYNASPIARISLVTRYNSAGGYTFMGGIEGGKENSTDGQFGGFVRIVTRPHGSTTQERLRISSTGHVTKPASCAFNVTPNGNQSLGSGETLTSWKTTDSRGFENTTTGGYFSGGIFTAPVTGAYYFTSNILLYDTNGTNSIHLYWQKNGSGTHTYWNTRFNSGDFGYQNYMPVAGACTMYMSAGDTCRIRISFSGSNCGMYGNDQNWGNWGGFLIG